MQQHWVRMDLDLKKQIRITTMERGFKELDLEVKTWTDPEFHNWICMVQCAIQYWIPIFGSGFQNLGMHFKNGIWISRNQSELQKQDMMV